MKRGRLGLVVLLVCGVSGAQGLKTITVGATGADFTTIQAAVTAAPDTGAVIKIRPGCIARWCMWTSRRATRGLGRMLDMSSTTARSRRIRVRAMCTWGGRGGTIRR
jgi:hypothetical protein